MVYLQAEFANVPSPTKRIAYFSEVARRWWEGSPYLCLKSEINGYRTHRYGASFRVAASKKSVAINDKSIVITNPEGHARRFFLKVWSVELHHSTSPVASSPSGDSPADYLKLRRRKETVTQALRYDEEKFKAAVQFLSEKGISVREHKNGRRVLPRKNKRKDFSRRHRPGF